VKKDVPSLRSKRLVREFESAFAWGCELGHSRLVHYAILGNHVHLIVESSDARCLGRAMKSIGGRFGRLVNRAFGRRGPVLADRHHLHVLRSPREVRNALSYVLLNSRKHARGCRAGRAVVDPASSGRWFDGWSQRSEIADPNGRRSVAAAHTWLLKSGWRRHGLIDQHAIPGPAG
jgi:hypothetical protein